MNWLGDSLDGTLARFRKRERPRYGFYVDHITDTIAAFFLMGGLAFSRYVHPAIVFGMLGVVPDAFDRSLPGDIHIGPIPAVLLEVWSYRNKDSFGNGELVLLNHSVATLFGKQFRLFDIGGSIAILGMILMLIVSVVAHTTQLYREELIVSASTGRNH